MCTKNLINCISNCIFLVSFTSKDSLKKKKSPLKDSTHAQPRDIQKSNLNDTGSLNIQQYTFDNMEEIQEIILPNFVRLKRDGESGGKGHIYARFTQ